jgi:ribonuclease HI
MFLLQFDACNRELLNIGSIGFVLFNDDIVLYEHCELLNDSKNSNYAEYSALIKALEFCIKFNIREIYIEGDAKIVIDQINNICNVKSDMIKPLYAKVNNLKNHFEFINFQHIYRKYNAFADSLANQALLNYI